MTKSPKSNPKLTGTAPTRSASSLEIAIEQALASGVPLDREKYEGFLERRRAERPRWANQPSAEIPCPLCNGSKRYLPEGGTKTKPCPVCVNVEANAAAKAAKAAANKEARAQRRREARGEQALMEGRLPASCVKAGHGKRKACPKCLDIVIAMDIADQQDERDQESREYDDALARLPRDIQANHKRARVMASDVDLYILHGSHYSFNPAREKISQLGNRWISIPRVPKHMGASWTLLCFDTSLRSYSVSVFSGPMPDQSEALYSVGKDILTQLPTVGALVAACEYYADCHGCVAWEEEPGLLDALAELMELPSP